ncbi:helix-turn-helix domain-containing protein [Saccharothrix longispora]|uniref:DNA-binding transcriptional regulator YiaG n=3 Tax=Saccharothrix longispora TaxID=33920 RepID=A0ABU1PPA6_9PSEU|nr:helix-turn-helix transcriptional regulator [Saccharothrix longispora]MDR6592497.1 DNA-binding transcriptional regulator YiaG [Saccharothrix longispora]
MDTDEKTATSRLSTARSRELGEELRRIRHRARLPSAVLAESLGWSLGKLSKLETGSRGTSPWEIATLLGRCIADKPSRDRVMAIAHEPDTGTFTRPHAGHPDSLTALTLHERAAATITTYDPLTIPALAQTPAYARALTGDNDLVEARIARQKVLKPDGGPVTVLHIHEVALRLVVGDRATMRDQLLHLTLMTGRPTVTAHVIPLTAPAHPALAHHATLLTFDPPTRPLAYGDNGTAVVFHDHPAEVEHHQRRMRELHARALPEAQSREVIAHWADAYDKRNR